MALYPFQLKLPVPVANLIRSKNLRDIEGALPCRITFFLPDWKPLGRTSEVPTPNCGLKEFAWTGKPLLRAGSFAISFGKFRQEFFAA